jgi:hypothetical protein
MCLGIPIITARCLPRSFLARRRAWRAKTQALKKLKNSLPLAGLRLEPSFQKWKRFPVTFQIISVVVKQPAHS